MVRSIVCGAILSCIALIAPQAAAGQGYHGSRHYASIANALPIASAAAVGSEASVPYGWADFCRRYTGECNTTPQQPEAIALTARAWRQIQRINSYVNATVVPVSDMDHWGVVDQWDYPSDHKGDCEDYALLKRKMLMDAGLPRSAILMTVVRDLHDEGHAVLTVKTDHGDFVLDNVNAEVRGWTATGYRFVKRQSEEDPNVWRTLRGEDVPAVATTR